MNAASSNVASPNRPALVIGLTGGIGSGKTTVANLLVEHGAAQVDTDAIAHELTGPGGQAMPAIEHEFGAQMLQTDGRLDRAAMRELAFRDPMARKRLEAILHPMIRTVTEQRLSQAARAPYALLVVPLLIESGNWKTRCDRVLVVDCSPQTQIERVIQRSGLPRDQIESILKVQASREQRLAAADDVIDNDGSPEALAPAVERLHRSYVELAAQRRHA